MTLTVHPPPPKKKKSMESRISRLTPSGKSNPKFQKTSSELNWLMSEILKRIMSYCPDARQIQFTANRRWIRLTIVGSVC